MPFDIRPVLMSDAEQWTKLMFDSFADDPISELLYPVPASPSLIEWSVHHILGEWGQNPTVRLMKIVETDTGNMVAGAQWMFLPEREGDEWTKGPDPSQLHHEYNKEAWTTISMTFREARHSIMGAQPYACKYKLCQRTEALLKSPCDESCLISKRYISSCSANSIE